MPTTDHLADDVWKLVQESVPIACSDVVPVRVNEYGRIIKVGLICRASPFDDALWTHVGGRIRLHESAGDAARRHLRDAIRAVDPATSPLNVEPEPRCFFEFFTSPRDGAGHDPRKQALSACYLAVVEGDVEASGEASELAWFALDDLPPAEQLWPGTADLVERVVAHRPDAQTLAYEALQSRASSHNEMTWQTPALAMTAQAFLMTIALGSDTAVTARVLAAGLGALVSLLSVQLMAKHAAGHDRDVAALEALEASHGLYLVHRKGPGFTGLARHGSRTWWTRGTVVFGLVCVATAVLAIFWPDVLS